MPSLSIVIPAFNEELRLPASLRNLASYLAETRPFEPVEVIVVDDGSQDRTGEVARAETQTLADAGASLTVIRNSSNRGKGYSVRRGLIESQYDWRLFTDADLSAPIEELEKLARDALSGNCDLAIGSRALDRSLIGTHQPFYREAMGRVFNLHVRLLTGLRIEDTQCGFKLISGRAASEIASRQRLNGFGFDVEQLFLAQKLGFKVAEVPVRWYNSADSRVGLSDGLKAFGDVLRVRWNDWLGRYG